MQVRDDHSIARFVEKTQGPAVIASLTSARRLRRNLDLRRRNAASPRWHLRFNKAVLADALDNTMTDFGREIIPGLLGKKNSRPSL